MSIARQCALAGVSRSSYHYKPLGTESEENLALMRVIDGLYLRRPFYGAPRMTDWLQEMGFGVNHKRVERLMRVTGLQVKPPQPHWFLISSKVFSASARSRYSCATVSNS